MSDPFGYVPNQRYGDLPWWHQPSWDILHVPTTAQFLYHSGVARTGPVWRALVAADIPILTSANLAPIASEQRATADTTISVINTLTDLTGATVTVVPTVASVAITWATFDVDPQAGVVAGDICAGYLDVDGANQGASMIYVESVAAQGRKTLSQIWMTALTAASHTLKLRAQFISGAGPWILRATHTKLITMVIANTNATLTT